MRHTNRRIHYFTLLQDGGRRHLGFLKFQIFNGRDGKRVELHLRAKFRQNRSNRGCPPSWICNACVGTTHEGHLVVFIIVQNLVRIDAVVLIICTFSISRVWLENAY